MIGDLVAGLVAYWPITLPTFLISFGAMVAIHMRSER